MYPLFDKNSLITRIVFLFLVFNVISILVFVFYIVQQDRNRITATMEDTLRQIATEKAKVISMSMHQVETQTENLGRWTLEYLYSEPDGTLPEDYYLDRDGVLSRIDQGGEWARSHTSVFLPAGVFGPDQVHEISATQRLEPVFRSIQQNADYLGWAYVALEDGFLRIYPYSDTSVFEADHQQKNDYYYRSANPGNNPERKVVWTNPYADYLGTGWMITCSSPMYRGEEFLGVACIDVNLETLQKKFLTDFRLSETGFAFVLDRSGNVIYHPDYLSKQNKEGDLLRNNLLESTQASENYKDAIARMLAEPGIGTIPYFTNQLDNKKMITFAPIEGQDWVLAVEVDYDEFLAVTKVEGKFLSLYILLAFFSLVLFSAFLYRQYAAPVNALRNAAERIAAGDYQQYQSPSGLTEIQELTDAFNFMSREIKDYTESLIHRNQEIGSILNSIDEVLMIIRPDYRILNLNEKGRALCGLDHRKLDPHQEAWLASEQTCFQTFYRSEVPCTGCLVPKVLNTGKPAHTRLVLRNQILDMSYYPIFNEDGQVLEIVVHSQSVTKNVLMEKELLQKEKLASIGQISSAIAHELKNPLAAIKGAVYLLDAYTKEQRDDRTNETIRTIAQVVEGAEKTIFNLLDFSSHGPGEVEEINVETVIQQILFLSNRERIRKNITVSMELGEEPFFYKGMREPLKAILQNLITNAVKAVPENGRIGIAVDRVDFGDIRIVITDNGPGISEEIQANLFKPFHTTDTTGKGTGLGLWITKMMVEKMNGSIEMKSTPEAGAAFVVRLPDHKEGKQ